MASTLIFLLFVRSSQVQRPQFKISGQLFSVSAEINPFGSHPQCNVLYYVCVLKGRRETLLWCVLITKANEMHYFSTLFWEIVHLFVFYYKNISRCTVLWMSNCYDALLRVLHHVQPDGVAISGERAASPMRETSHCWNLHVTVDNQCKREEGKSHAYAVVISFNQSRTQIFKIMH
jgi:hypothetical protein